MLIQLSPVSVRHTQCAEISYISCSLCLHILLLLIVYCSSVSQSKQYDCHLIVACMFSKIAALER